MALAAALAGCSAGLGSLRGAALPPRARVAGAPAFTQTEHHCGPAALASLLSWAGRPETPDSLAPLVYAPARSGTLPVGVLTSFMGAPLFLYLLWRGYQR